MLHVHQIELFIGEHYTDTAGATDHVSGLCCLFGFQFAPRIRDLKERKLYTIEEPVSHPLLEPLIGEAIEAVWCYRRSSGASSPRRGPAEPCRAPCGCSAGSPQAVHPAMAVGCRLASAQPHGLNKGDASTSPRRAVFFHRHGEIRDRTFENESFHASGLSLITAAIVLWNTVCRPRRPPAAGSG
jgi:TnpA family transposase